MNSQALHVYHLTAGKGGPYWYMACKLQDYSSFSVLAMELQHYRLALSHRYVYPILTRTKIWHWMTKKKKIEFLIAIYIITELFYMFSFGWVSDDLSNDQSSLVQVMAWCLQAPSHYLNQWWSIPPSATWTFEAKNNYCGLFFAPWVASIPCRSRCKLYQYEVNMVPG